MRLPSLARVNLLVGSNNSGKSSVLEAVRFLAMNGAVSSLLASLRHRGESPLVSPEGWNDWAASDIRFLFNGRSLDGGKITLEASHSEYGSRTFAISANRYEFGIDPGLDEVFQRHRRRYVASARRKASPSLPMPPGLDDDEVDVASTGLPRVLEVTRDGEILSQLPLWSDSLLFGEELFMQGEERSDAQVRLISPSSLTQASLARLLDRALIDNEDTTAVGALQIIEPSLTKVVAVERSALSRGGGRGILVGMSSDPQLVPLGSLGDGMSRMLAIALSLVAAKNGFLLIDEIDTGLHHTVMKKMWRLVCEAARRLNVSVFATTHSFDCVHALAAVSRADRNPQDDPDQVSLLRVDRDIEEAVHFSEREILQLADREIEPR
jgi:hypothetical protein